MSGGGGGQPTSENITTSTIPSYLAPEVQSLIGGATQQIFQTKSGQVPVLDSNGNPVMNSDGTPQMQSGQTISGVNPYTPYSANPSDYVAGFSPLQQQVQANASNLQMPGQYNTASNMATQAGAQGMGTAGSAMGYGGMGAGYGQQGVNLGVQGGGMYGSQGSSYGSNAAGLAGGAQGYGNLGAQQGLSYGQNATNPGAVQAYMNPYLQASLAPQEALLAQQQGQQQATNQAQATQAGAFGGSRMGVQNALQNQSNQLAMSNLVGQGYNNAFNTANQNMQAAANLGMQGAQSGISGLNAANQAYQTGIQGAGMGLQGVGQQLAGTAQGMQGAQTGLSGVSGAQNAYNLGNTAASNLANIGTQQTGTQQNLLNLQNTIGGTQQQQQQNIINNAINNYAQAQQYPMQQYNAYNALLRGYAVPGQTTTSYQAAPSATSMLTGLGTAGIGAAQLMKSNKKGGKISGDGIDKLAINNALKRKAKA
jgi:hypothetical protein